MKHDIYFRFFDILVLSVRKSLKIQGKGDDRYMKRITNYLMRVLMKRKGVLNAFMLVGGLTSILAKYGCCFYIFHQPKLPDSLKDIG